MKYKVKVNNELEFDITPEEIEKMDVVKTSENTFHILNENQSYTASIHKSDFNNKAYSVSINNSVFDITIENELDLLIKSLGFEIGSKKQINEIHAPMPGLVLEINVEIGQSIKENDSLLILEAMKMENSITSPINGIIKSISVKKGDAVDKNQLLIEFE